MGPFQKLLVLKVCVVLQSVLYFITWKVFNSIFQPFIYKNSQIGDLKKRGVIKVAYFQCLARHKLLPCEGLWSRVSLLHTGSTSDSTLKPLNTGQYSHCCYKICDKSKLEKKELTVGRSTRRGSREGMEAGAWGGCLYFLQSQESINVRPSIYVYSAQDPSCVWCHPHLNWALSSQVNHSRKSSHTQCLGNTFHINPKNLAKLTVKITAQTHQGLWFQCW